VGVVEPVKLPHKYAHGLNGGGGSNTYIKLDIQIITNGHFIWKRTLSFVLWIYDVHLTDLKNN